MKPEIEPLKLSSTMDEVRKYEGQHFESEVESRELGELLAESERCASDQTVESGTTLVDWESALSDEPDLPTDVITDWDVGLDPPEVTPFL